MNSWKLEYVGVVAFGIMALACGLKGGGGYGGGGGGPAPEPYNDTPGEVVAHGRAVALTTVDGEPAGLSLESGRLQIFWGDDQGIQSFELSDATDERGVSIAIGDSGAVVCASAPGVHRGQTFVYDRVLFEFEWVASGPSRRTLMGTRETVLSSQARAAQCRVAMAPDGTAWVAWIDWVDDRRQIMVGKVGQTPAVVYAGAVQEQWGPLLELGADESGPVLLYNTPDAFLVRDAAGTEVEVDATARRLLVAGGEVYIQSNVEGVQSIRRVDMDAGTVGASLLEAAGTGDCAVSSSGVPFCAVVRGDSDLNLVWPEIEETFERVAVGRPYAAIDDSGRAHVAVTGSVTGGNGVYWFRRGSPGQ